MTTFALLHGSGDGGWAWHAVRRELRERGHEAVAPDLPTDGDHATWDGCVDVVVEAVERAGVGRGDDLVVVGHSAGGFVVPLAASRLAASLQVYVAGMVPRPGEDAEGWFGAVGWFEAVAAQADRDGGLTGDPDPMIAFYHDVPAELAVEARARERPTSEQLGRTAWPRSALPTIPARYVVTTRDRFLPPAVQRYVAVERLGIDHPDEVESGHCPHLGRPEDLAELLAGYAGVAARG